VRRAAAGLLVALACAPRAVTAPPPPEPAPPRPAEFTPIPAEEAARVRNPHDHRGRPLCQRCHAPGAAGVTKDPIALCAECHDPVIMRHPFRVRAADHARDLPLMPGRIVACHTCHDPHDVKARRAGLRLRYTELCLECHARHAPPPGRGTSAGAARP
jgi:predicted CXXCH cytochrome family protein